jgi:hypothetical protein
MRAASMQPGGGGDSTVHESWRSRRWATGDEDPRACVGGVDDARQLFEEMSRHDLLVCEFEMAYYVAN